MKSQQMLTLTVVVCIAGLLVSHVTCIPAMRGLSNQLGEKEREQIMHYAAKIIKIALGSESTHFSGSAADKRNSGMLDAVLDMPDLLTAGRK